MIPRLLRRLRCELSASHRYETRAEFCARGATVHTHFVSRCARCGEVFIVREQGVGESPASLALGLAGIVLVFIFAFVLLPVLT